MNINENIKEDSEIVLTHENQSTSSIRDNNTNFLDNNMNIITINTKNRNIVNNNNSYNFAVMTSLEISNIIGKRHDNVRRTIESLASDGIITLPQNEVKPSKGGRPIKLFSFIGEKGRRDSIIVAAQLSPELTAKIVDRWSELEEEKRVKQFNLPSNYIEALKALVISEEKKIELKKQLEIAEPKVEFVDNYVSSEGLVSLRNVGRSLGVMPNKFVNWLRDVGYLFKEGKTNVPYAKYKNQKLFETKNVLDNNGNIRIQTYVTAKGIEYFSHMLPEGIMIK